MKRREPLQFMLVMAIGASGLIFFFLLTAYVARQHTQGWNAASLPSVFWVSTAAIVLSSLTLHIGIKAFRQEVFPRYRLCMGLTFGLGVAFIILQILGWLQLFSQNISLQNSLSGAFIYIISGLHLLHILGGLVFLGMVFTESLRNFTYVNSFVYSVNPPNQLKIRLVILYWHFVDVLWVILFVFLLLN